MPTDVVRHHNRNSPAEEFPMTSQQYYIRQSEGGHDVYFGNREEETGRYVMTLRRGQDAADIITALNRNRARREEAMRPCAPQERRL
jgi:hypothetical protein